MDSNSKHGHLFGKPDLPLPWRGYLLDHSILAHVTRIDSATNAVWINKGSSDTVFVGCEFYAIEVINFESRFIHSPVTLRVVEVTEHESKAEPSELLKEISESKRFLKKDSPASFRHEEDHSSLGRHMDELQQLFRRLTLGSRVSTRLSDIIEKSWTN